MQLWLDLVKDPQLRRQTVDSGRRTKKLSYCDLLILDAIDRRKRNRSQQITPIQNRAAARQQQLSPHQQQSSSKFEQVESRIRFQKEVIADDDETVFDQLYSGIKLKR